MTLHVVRFEAVDRATACRFQRRRHRTPSGLEGHFRVYREYKGNCNERGFHEAD